MSNEAKAKEMIAQAQRKLNSYSFFGSKTAKYEDAGELYSKAANLLKIAKNGLKRESALQRPQIVILTLVAVMKLLLAW